MKKASLWIAVLAGLMAISFVLPADVLAQQATHRQFRYSQIHNDTAAVTSAGDTAEVSFSSTAHRVIVRIDTNDTGTVNLALGSSDADKNDFHLADGDKEFIDLENVATDFLNLRSDGPDATETVVRVWAFQEQ